MNKLSMYERVMGESFARLPDAVQRFHRLQGRTVLHGRVQTHAPASALARLLAYCLGTPSHASAGPLRFDLDASPEVESWTRCFPTHTMTSQMRVVGDKIEERLGAARLTFKLTVADGALKMELASIRFLGIPCPKWLSPHVVAEELGSEDELHFRVAAALPWVGMVASYSGHLSLGPKESS